MDAPVLTSGHITCEIIDEVAVVILDRPGSLNALTNAARVDLAAAIRYYGGGAAQGIVITGRGRAFSAGEDLYSVSATPEDLVYETESFHDMSRAVLDTCVPVVGAINGIAVGGCAEFTLSFDARFGARTAEYFFPENQLGLVISNAASYLLPRLVGPSAATRIILSAQRMNASEALGVGLLDKLVEADLVDSCIQQIHSWAQNGSATAQHLRLMRPPAGDVEAAFRRETDGVRAALTSGITAAGISRFVSSRST